MLRFEIVGKTEKQGAVLGPYRFAFDNPADRAAAHLPLLLAVGISDLAILEKLKDGEVARSPGMKYKHYAPKADVTILKGSFDAYRDYIAAHAGDGVWALCFDGEEAQLPVPAISYGKEGDGISEAHNLFTVLRELDRKGAKTVYARCPLSDGVSMAVYNRLIRAAAFRVVEV